MYGLTDNVFDTVVISQLATNPHHLNFKANRDIIWYKDWDDSIEPLNVVYHDISDIQRDRWKIWECNTYIYNCSYIKNLILKNGNGVLKLEYNKGKLIELKYWFNKDNYFKHDEPNLIKQ